MPNREVLGRDTIVSELVAAVSRRGAALVGPPGSGLSTVALRVAAELSAGDVAVRIIHLPDDRADVIDDDAHLLVVDDVHHGTRTQLLRLRDVALTRPVVLTARAGAASDVIRWLWRSGVVEHLELPRLDDDTVARIVEACAGGFVPRAVVDAIVHRAAGRPGFAVDEARSLTAGRATFPPSRQLIERTFDLLADVPPPLANAIRTIAIAGRVPAEATSRLGIDVAALEHRGLACRTDDAYGLSVSLDPPALAPAVRAILAAPTSVELATRILEACRDALSPDDRARVRVSAGEDVDLTDLASAARVALRDGLRDDAAHLAALAARHGPEGEDVAATVLDELGERQGAASYYAAIMLNTDAAPGLRARAAMENSLITMWDLARPDDAIATAAALADAARDSPFAGAAGVHLASLMLYGGRPREAIEIIDAIDAATLDELVAAGHAFVVSTSRALIAPERADTTELEPFVRGARTGPFERGVMAAGVGLIHELTGRYSQALSLVSEARAVMRTGEPPSSLAWLALAEARAHLAMGHREVARRAALEATTLFAEINHRSGHCWSIGAQLLTDALVDDREATQRTLRLLEDSGPAIPFLDADLLRARAWAAWRLGNSEASITLFKAAADMAAACGAVTLEAVALHDAFRLLRAPVRSRLADLARRAPAPSIILRARHTALVHGDPATLLALSAEMEAAGALLLAAEVAGDAVEPAAAAGLRSLSRTAHGVRARLAEACGHPSTPSLGDHRSDKLTAREHDVVTLAIDGCSSREIGGQLGVSVRTVDNLLLRAYVKLGVHSRSELAARLSGSEQS